MDPIDLLKLNQSPSLDDQMDMMLMMMQLPEHSSSQGNNELANFQPPKFSEGATTTNIAHTTMPLPNSLDDNYPLMPWSSPSFTNNSHLHLLPSSTTSFTNNNLSSSTTTLMIIQQHDHRTPSNVPKSYAKCNSSEKQHYSMDAMREMIYRMAAMQPIHIDPESVKPPKRRNVKISKDPQSVAARHRRERISERIRILQRLVPGGTKMDTASMLDEAIHYVKFLKTQVQSLEQVAAANNSRFPVPMSSESTSTGTPYLHLTKSYQGSNSQVRSAVED